jgi:hypothetical protein
MAHRRRGNPSRFAMSPNRTFGVDRQQPDVAKPVATLLQNSKRTRRFQIGRCPVSVRTPSAPIATQPLSDRAGRNCNSGLQSGPCFAACDFVKAHHVERCVFVQFELRIYPRQAGISRPSPRSPQHECKLQGRPSGSPLYWLSVLRRLARHADYGGGVFRLNLANVRGRCRIVESQQAAMLSGHQDAETRREFVGSTNLISRRCIG